ncbi:hypothetical protein ACIREO_00075 [Streptomyces sp. NPDC102441]|uniref:hypothetical protein n=1 Tax=Streptomyces sp. NPDC102441 TaxID=3366176 RepID=UPI0038290C98
MKRSALTGNADRRLLPSIVGVMILAVISSACAADAKSYETPESLCGTPVPSKLLDPFMTPGKKVSTVSRSETEGIRRCRLYVDDKEILSASTLWISRDTSLLEVAAMAYNSVDPGDKKTKDGRYIYSKTGAIGTVTCQPPPTPNERVFASIRISGGKPDAEALKNLIREYSEKLANSDHCS